MPPNSAKHINISLYVFLLTCAIILPGDTSTSDSPTQPSANPGNDFTYLLENERKYAIFSERSSNKLVSQTFGAVEMRIQYGLGFILKDKNYALLELTFSLINDSVTTKISISKMLLMPEDFDTLKYVTNKGLAFTSPYVYKLYKGLYFVISFPVMNFQPENIDVSMMLQIKGTMGSSGFEATFNKTIPSILVKRKVYDAGAYASYKDFFIEGRLPTHTNVNENTPGQEDKLNFVKLKQLNKKDSQAPDKTTTIQKPKEQGFIEKYKWYLLAAVVALIGGYYYYSQQQNPPKAIAASMSQTISPPQAGQLQNNNTYF